ncbi:adenylosuccinate synthase [bacterium]|nr:adenylosuccinate synthase [bacterium]
MRSLVVVGAQWGDEGKGKLVDFLTSNADLVVRFQGGNNAGHTLMVDGVTTKLRLVPSGILRPHLTCCIAAGVALDGDVLYEELQELERAGVSVPVGRLVIDESVHLIMPYHRVTDLAREEARGKQKIGTTGRGIGPCYEDRASRSGVRVAELRNLERCEARLEKILEEKNRYLKDVLQSKESLSLQEVMEYLKRAQEKVLPFAGNVGVQVAEARKREQRILFEGAQGTLLDQTHGTIPYVTSSHTVAGAVCTGVGIGPNAIDHVLGVTKAYTTRVGSGPFPTEDFGAAGEYLQRQGSEFGTVTGRSRRCGWFDAVLLRKAIRLNGIDMIALTKLDVLSGLEEIKVCSHYTLDGERCLDAPVLADELERVEPHYVSFEGWKEDIREVKKWHHLPQNARIYLSSLAEMIECDISMVSVGAERESTLFAHGAQPLQNFIESV